MKTSLSALLVAAIAATLASPVAATPAGEAAGKGPRAYPMDCTKAKDKARCEFLNRDIEACKAIRPSFQGWRTGHKYKDPYTLVGDGAYWIATQVEKK